jgi:protein O-mannosyl-transferase
MAKKHSATVRQRESASPKRNIGSWALKDLPGMALIFLASLAAYFPALRGGILWDDAGHLTAPALQSVRGLWRIWTELGATQQYYPILHSAFWIEHLFWGDSLLGYHLINILLHTISAYLVVLIVRRLRLPGAWLAGFIFALHPVCVEAVSWISEQKSTLSGVLYLAAGLIYLRFDEDRKRSTYFWASGLFLLAVLSKTVTATLPAALLVVLWWQRRQLKTGRDLIPLLPWFGFGISAGLFTAWFEKFYIGAQGPEFSLSFLQRLLVAGHAIWFYLFKLVWPSNLIFIYPRFKIDTGAWYQYLYPAGVVILAACLLFLRRRGLLAGWLFFIGTLFPVLGFLDVFPFIYSYVADHFQYLACLGIIVPASAGLASVFSRLQKPEILPALSARKKSIIVAAACALIPFVFFVMSRAQSRIYVDAETLWRTTVVRNPGSWMANNNLSDVLFGQERVDEAMPYARTAVGLNPNDAQSHASLGNILRYKEQLDEAAVHYRRALELAPNNPSYHGSLANTYLEMGKIVESVPEYETAWRLDPSNGLLANNLAWVLATCPLASVRNGAKALELARRAVEIVGTEDPTVMGTLAAALAEAGNFKEAVSAEEKAYALAKMTGDAETREWHAQLLETYRVGEPHRESSLAPK